MSTAPRNRRDDDDEDEQPDDDRPMNEQQWEAMLRESDLRAARYGELLETLMDDPNRDEIVAREMGWDHLADEMAEDKAGESWKRAGGGEDEGEEDGADEEAGASAGWESEGATGNEAGGEDADDDPFADPSAAGPDDETAEEEDRAVESIPAYHLAFETAMRVFHAFKPWLDRRADEEDEVGQQLQDAVMGIQIAGSKIAGGHGMGYDDHALCGNIVCCRRALAGAEQSARGLEALKAGGVVPADLCQRLLADVLAAKKAIEDRIAELRARVWW